MFKFDLLNIFEGMVRNYSKFNLNKNDSKERIIKKELNYIQLVGEILGYSSTINYYENDKGKKNIIWKDFDDDKSLPNNVVFHFFREDDITKDVATIHSLLTEIKNGSDITSYMLFIEVSSEARIEYLNSMLKCDYIKDREILIVYKISRILESKSELSAHLFKKGINYRQRYATSYIDIFDNIKVKFINK